MYIQSLLDEIVEKYGLEKNKAGLCLSYERGIWCAKFSKKCENSFYDAPDYEGYGDTLEKAISEMDKKMEEDKYLPAKK